MWLVIWISVGFLSAAFAVVLYVVFDLTVTDCVVFIKVLHTDVCKRDLFKVMCNGIITKLM